MFDLGFLELLLIGIVALIVVGPKDLPGMFRQLGRFTGKMRGMAREFQRAMEDAADESGVKDIKNMGADVSKTLKAATNPVGASLDAVKDATKGWSSSLTDGTAGPATQKLAADRAEAAEKIRNKAAEKATERKAAEAAAAEVSSEIPVARPAPAKKTAPKKAPAKKAAPKKAATKKAPAKKTTAAKTAAKKAPAKKTTAKKPAAKAASDKDT